MNALYTNIPEDGLEITHTIYDGFGKAYTVDGCLTPTGFISYVCSEVGLIGRINWTTSQPGVMVIADLIIFDFQRPKPLWARVLPFFYKQPSYKRRELGTAMLNFIISSARAMGVSEIRGQIIDSDLKATPRLLKFYRKHGFTVEDDLSFYQVLD